MRAYSARDATQGHRWIRVAVGCRRRAVRVALVSRVDELRQGTRDRGQPCSERQRKTREGQRSSDAVIGRRPSNACVRWCRHSRRRRLDRARRADGDVHQERAPTLVAVTDANGEWKAPRVMPGAYVVAATAKGYLPARTRSSPSSPASSARASTSCSPQAARS